MPVQQTRELALDHYADRQRFVAGAGEVAAQLWSEVNPARVVDSWAEQIPEMTAVVSGAQLGAARRADPYTTDVLESEDVDPEAVAPVDPQGFSGQASDARGLVGLLTNPVFVTLAAVKDGWDIARALMMGRSNLDMLVRTQVADAGRLADQVALTARPAATGYVRVAVGNSCARCLILAGKTYEWNRGFQRHPRCDCIHLPSAIARARRLIRDPRDIYDSMTVKERLRAGFTRADMRAIADGADLNQVVNAQRGVYLPLAPGRVRRSRRQDGVTTEGATRRGLAGGRLRGRDRMSVNEIYQVAGDDRTEALQLLYEHGYLLTRPLIPVPGAVTVGTSGRLVSVPGGPTVLRATSSGATGVPAGGVAVRQVLADAKTSRSLALAIEAEYRRLTGRDIFVAPPPGGSLQTMREHAEGVLRGVERFPDARLTSIGSFDDGVEAYAHAVAGEINFSEFWSARRDRYLASLQGDVDVGWHPRGFGSPVAVAVHEFGHVLDLETLTGRIHSRVLSTVHRRAAQLGVEPDTLAAREISGYAGSDVRELVAEAFTDVMVNGPSASVLSREIFDLIEAEYRRGGFAPSATVVARATPAPDLSKLTVPQLRALAKERGVTVPSGARKADIVSALGGAKPSKKAAKKAVQTPEMRAMDRARGVAELLSEVDELLSSQASVRALRHRIESRARVATIPPATLRAILDAADDPAKLRAAVEKAAKGAKLTPSTPVAGEVVGFDPKTMASIGADIPAGALVRIVRPGYTATVGGKKVTAVRGGVFELTPEEATAHRRAQQRAAARERQRQIATFEGTARLLAEVDELLSKKATAVTIRQRLDPKLIEPEQLFANADPAVLQALRVALESGDLAKLRSTVTRLTTKAKIKATSKAGAKVKYDPDTMEPVGGVDIPAGAQVVVVTRGSTVVIDGETVVLTKPKVAEVRPPHQSKYAARERELKARMRGVLIDERELGGGFDAAARLLIYRDGSRVVQKLYGPATSARARLSALEAAEHADSEILAARVMDAVGARAPVVTKTGRSRGEISMEWVDGRTAAEVPDALAKYIDSDDGRLMGLADFIMTNEDRHGGNWMIDESGRLVGIDHGRVFFGESISRNDFVDGRFGSRVPRSARAEHSRIPGFAPGVMVIDNDMSPSDMAIIRGRLEALRSEFVRAGRLGWFDRMMLRFSEAERHATGTRSRLTT